MPFPIVKSLLGLTQLLRLRTGGLLPNALSDQVVPIVDVADMFGQDLLGASDVSSAASAMPASVADTVGAASLRVKALSARVTVGANAGTFLNLSVGFRVPGVASTIWVASREVDGVQAATPYFVGCPIPDLQLGPGSVFIAQVTGDQTGADHVVAVQSAFQRLADNV